jgi:hypothetical protein
VYEKGPLSSSSNLWGKEKKFNVPERNKAGVIIKDQEPKRHQTSPQQLWKLQRERSPWSYILKENDADDPYDIRFQ